MTDLHTLGRWPRDRALATPDRVAVDDRGVTLTYRALEERATALAARFRAAGYGVGDRVATVTGNSSDQVVLFFACAKAGLVLAPLSWRLSPHELAAQLDRADPALVLVAEECGTLADAALERLPLPPSRTALGPHGVEARVPPPTRRSLAEPPPSRAVHDDDPLLLVFTSGTGGTSRGALLTHANCFWNNLSLSRTVELTSADVVLSVLPQFHVGGWNIQPLLAWWTGATVVLERTFEPERVLRLVADRRVTTMMGVPTNYLLLAEHPGFAAADLSSLRHAVVGGAPMPEPLLRAWHRRGVALTQGYGLTEAGPNVLCLPDDVARDRAGSAGVPYPHVEVAVADPVTGEHLAGPATGELLVRGPSVFAGYFRDPEATAASFARGWLRTGDLVERDADGYYRVVDRLKDVFITGGENVTPAEVEAVLRRHPAVADAAVVGVPDDRWGEVGHAFVVPRGGRLTDADDLEAFCRRELAGYKVPRHFELVPDLPRSSLDKVVRSALAPERPDHDHDTIEEAR
ncbi:class I adenylate-forming enzyme family protein [Promicromonospora thailandica]|uniref:Fatty-acyl-CoA synthase n=1 Tax=Promicromonospora thailandica TaxID=765201 RepID=A0A9X2JWG9_9MICO|nr:AMP-binding protein [Promicromonospora thailandica]MCP2263119.1 fatty-acyl-CoA synthase [Promicromonospora thailandica]BFF18497.1 long-chain fatty acid--CoA ligase [Promicromonospora thailandica]